MANANVIKITLNGVHYTITTTEPEDYVMRLAHELDEQVHAIIEKNPSLSFNDVMVLCCMGYVDSYRRSEENADRMRSQVSEYLEDAAKARIALDDNKRECASMKKERDEARRENGNLKKQLEQARQELAALKKGASPAKTAAKQKASPETEDAPPAEQPAPAKAEEPPAPAGPVAREVDGCRIVDHRETAARS